MEEQITISKIGSKLADTGIQLGTDGVNELLNTYKKTQSMADHKSDHTGEDSKIAEQMITKTEARNIRKRRKSGSGIRTKNGN